MELTTHLQLVPRLKNMDLFIHSPIGLRSIFLLHFFRLPLHSAVCKKNIGVYSLEVQISRQQIRSVLGFYRDHLCYDAVFFGTWVPILEQYFKYCNFRVEVKVKKVPAEMILTTCHATRHHKPEVHNFSLHHLDSFRFHQAQCIKGPIFIVFSTCA
jgi:hypothetical protein